MDVAFATSSRRAALSCARRLVGQDSVDAGRSPLFRATPPSSFSKSYTQPCPNISRKLLVKRNSIRRSCDSELQNED